MYTYALNCCHISVCLDYVRIVKDKAACWVEDWDAFDNGTCYNGTLTALWDQTIAKKNKIERTLPSEEYFE